MRHPLLQDASRIFVTADSHFGHAEAIDLYDRPFTDEAEMTSAMIDRWNETLRPDDLLVHLGDFVGDLSDSERKIRVATEVRERIAVDRILLVRGNHDSKRPEYARIFDDVVDLLDHRPVDSPLRVVMTHYPLRSWRGNRRGSFHLHGHTHGRLEEIGRSTDVGVDCWRFRPIPLEPLLGLLAERPVVALPKRRTREQPDRDSRRI